MRKIISLFLSLILIFTMTLGVFMPGAAFAAPTAKTLEKADTVLINTMGKSVENNGTLSYIEEGATEPSSHSQIAFTRTTLTSFSSGENNFEYRTTGGSNNGAARFEVYPYGGAGKKDLNGCKFVLSGEYKSSNAVTKNGIDYIASGEVKFNRNETGEFKVTIKEVLKANVWYNFEFVIDATKVNGNDNIASIKFTELGQTTPTISSENTFSIETGWFRCDMINTMFATLSDVPGAYDTFRNLKMVKSYPSIERADILTINSAASNPLIDPNQKNLTFTLSEKIDGLEASHVTAVDELGSVNSAASLDISSDGKTVTATMEQNLNAWTDYTLYINPSVYEGYTYVTGGGTVSQSELSKAFSVKSTGFDMKEISISSAGSKATFDMKYTNADSSCQPVTMVLPVYSADGKMISIKSQSIAQGDLPVGGATKTVTIEDAYESGNIAKMFAINGWSGKTPHFGRYWGIPYTPASLEAYSSAEPITLGEFDYNNKKIKVGVNTGTGTETSGVLYVYESGATLSDSVAPVYADFLTSASDGTFTLEIPFKSDVNANTTTYNVEFYYSGYTPITGSFICYDADDIQSQKETAIYSDAAASTTVGGLKQAILGIDELENVINDNFAVFDVKADTSVYAGLTNKDNVFSLMLGSVSTLTDYDALVDLFEAKALEQYGVEHTVVVNPSKDNSSYGSVSGGMKDTAPVTPAQPNNPALPGAAGFSDMAGHWAAEFASELSNRGIMNGYPDGSFNGEGDITRAEIAKTLMSALGIAQGTNAPYSDVAPGAWYTPYIAGASNSGIITGFEDGTYGPELRVTRQDAALMLYRAISTKMTLPVGFTFFTDDLDISDYASDAIRSLGDLKIISGTPDGRFNPLAPITRAEIAALVCRALDYIESH